MLPVVHRLSSSANSKTVCLSYFVFPLQKQVGGPLCCGLMCQVVIFRYQSLVGASNQEEESHRQAAGWNPRAVVTAHAFVQRVVTIYVATLKNRHDQPLIWRVPS